jgi:O-succinylbenzoate synthase
VPQLTEHLFWTGRRVVVLLEGPAGWGEWSPLPGYPADEVVCRQAAEEAAILGFPPPVRDAVPVNALVDGPVVDPDALRGFPAVKVKVQERADVDRVARVRDAVGPSVAVRVDANGAWSVEEAVDMIGRLARYHLELVEQPVASVDDLARVRRAVGVPIAADECVRTVHDAARLRAQEAADVLVVKQQPVGGVRDAMAIVEAAGLPAIVSSMMETSIGIAAGVALAAALPELPFACGLATLGRGEADVTSDPLVPVDGSIGVRAVVPDLVLGQPGSQDRSSDQNEPGSSR